MLTASQPARNKILKLGKYLGRGPSKTYFVTFTMVKNIQVCLFPCQIIPVLADKNVSVILSLAENCFASCGAPSRRYWEFQHIEVLHGDHNLVAAFPAVIQSKFQVMAGK